MENPQNLREQFEQELARHQNSYAQRKRKLITYLIRSGIAVALYYYFWEHQWLRYSLFLYVPLNILGLLSILNPGFLMKGKINRVRQKLDKAENFGQNQS